MKILIIGEGGREHALAWKLSNSPKVSNLFCAPGNPGIAQLAQVVEIATTDTDSLIQFARVTGIDLVVIGPEAPLTSGLVDQMFAAGIPAYGPNQAAAVIEGSKVFAKELMRKYSIPTAEYASFSDQDEALTYLQSKQAPIVVKVDGLAAGKGVTVAHTIAEAQVAVTEAMSGSKFGAAGRTVVIEEFLSGQEISLMAFVDGKDVIPMVPAQDHKAAFNGDQGPNTGGMGAYSPVPQIDSQTVEMAVDKVLVPVAAAMVQEGRPYTGVLYAGLMITDAGPKVIEFNARFGDPETQVVLPRMVTDLVEIIQASLEHRLGNLSVAWSPQAAVNVVAASQGYPGDYSKGSQITGLEVNSDGQALVFHAGTVRAQDNSLRTNGGRVLSVTGQGATVLAAATQAYKRLAQIHFPGIHYRTDIGHRCTGRSFNLSEL